VALAWLLAKEGDIAVIPGTKRVERVQENTAADTLNKLTPPAGGHHTEEQMRLIDR